MSTKRADGGSVFPSALAQGAGGLTLRDFFAAHAMLASQQALQDAFAKGMRLEPGQSVPGFIAKNAHALADAMLAEREQSR